MDLQLTGKTALVTGATAGIGLAIARTLAQEGVAVTLTGRDPAKLQKAASSITDATPDAQVSTVVVDLGTLEGAEALFAARYGALRRQQISAACCFARYGRTDPGNRRDG